VPQCQHIDTGAYLAYSHMLQLHHPPLYAQNTSGANVWGYLLAAVIVDWYARSGYWGGQTIIIAKHKSMSRTVLVSQVVWSGIKLEPHVDCLTINRM